jgi:hypothetical protein
MPTVVEMLHLTRLRLRPTRHDEMRGGLRGYQVW